MKKPCKDRIKCWPVGRPPNVRVKCKKLKCKKQLHGFLPKRISGFRVGG